MFAIIQQWQQLRFVSVYKLRRNLSVARRSMNLLGPNCYEAENVSASFHFTDLYILWSIHWRHFWNL